MKLDEFIEAYIECALWSTNDESTPGGGEPLDQNYGFGDIAPDCLAAMVADCKRFQDHNREEIETWDLVRICGCPPLPSPDEMAGHDFWLTRNGHGAGFWDGDWGEKIGKQLTDACREYPEVCLYVGDDGKIYC